MRNLSSLAYTQTELDTFLAFFQEIFKKKSHALVGRVNTFIILHTKKFKIAFKIRNL
jgi:hypothetical protein